MLIEHHREKLINGIIYFVKNTRYCGKTKLFKLLYYLDFIHFRETGKSITGLDYYAWDFGPVPAELYNEMNELPTDLKESITIIKNKDKDFIEIKPKKKFDNKFFTKRELRLLDKIAYIFKDAKAEQMVESTHLLNEPWHTTINKTGEKSRIDYFLALDNSKDSLLLEEALERVKDREKLKKALA
jgi:uncharacterized phage-associated protein